MLFKFTIVILVYITQVNNVLESHLKPLINQLTITMPSTLKPSALLHQLLCAQ
jgi:hypothetical protein